VAVDDADLADLADLLDAGADAGAGAGADADAGLLDADLLDADLLDADAALQCSSVSALGQSQDSAQVSCQFSGRCV